MKQITPTHFENAIRENPAWASTLHAPVEIVGHCYLHKSPITHLLPLLHFSGRDREGNVAAFYNCASLKVAEGTFNGGVTFKGSGIEQIDTENLKITKPNEAGWAAGFSCCKNLKVAEGTFPGWVCFAESSIEQINSEKLLISQPDREGYAASFAGCERLRVAEGAFHGFVDFSNSGIERIDPKLRRQLQGLPMPTGCRRNLSRIRRLLQLGHRNYRYAEAHYSGTQLTRLRGLL